jgi:hypothetical protein
VYFGWFLLVSADGTQPLDLAATLTDLVQCTLAILQEFSQRSLFGVDAQTVNDVGVHPDKSSIWAQKQYRGRWCPRTSLSPRSFFAFPGGPVFFFLACSSQEIFSSSVLYPEDFRHRASSSAC